MPYRCRQPSVPMASHWLYEAIPRHRSQLHWYDVGHWLTWSLLGKDDDGLFGEKARFKPDSPPSLAKALAWNLRNPLHNLFFYVIGTAYCTNSAFVLFKLCREECNAFRYQAEADTVYAGKGPSLYLALHGWKPFISTRLVWTRTRESRFYVGWRCRGNFGITCIPLGRRKAGCLNLPLQVKSDEECEGEYERD